MVARGRKILKIPEKNTILNYHPVVSISKGMYELAGTILRNVFWKLGVQFTRNLLNLPAYKILFDRNLN